MHRIRLHSQWKRNVLNQVTSCFSRNFHCPTGLQETDSVFFTVALAETEPLSASAIAIRLNDVQLVPLITPSGLRVDITAHLHKFNRLELEFFQKPNSNQSEHPLWPLENPAIEIHSHPLAD